MGEIKGIIEEVDLSTDKKENNRNKQRNLLFNKEKLFQALEKVSKNNKQGEYYLTDTVKILLGEGLTVGNVIVKDYSEILGINNRLDLANASQKYIKNSSRLDASRSNCS